jgi:hypothetical protein
MRHTLTVILSVLRESGLFIGILELFHITAQTHIVQEI